VVDGADVAGDADGGARRPGHGVGREVHAPDGGDDGVDLFRRGLAVHDDEHGEGSSLSPLAKESKNASADSIV